MTPAKRFLERARARRASLARERCPEHGTPLVYELRDELERLVAVQDHPWTWEEAERACAARDAAERDP